MQCPEVVIGVIISRHLVFLHKFLSDLKMVRLFSDLIIERSMQIVFRITNDTSVIYSLWQYVGGTLDFHLTVFSFQKYLAIDSQCSFFSYLQDRMI